MASKKHIPFLLFLLCSFLLVLACSKNDVTGDPADDVPDPGDDGGPSGVFVGEIDFVQTFGGSAEDEAVGVVQANDGGYVIAGSTKSNDGDITDKPGTDYDYLVLKLSAAGERLWSKTYGGTADDRATGISNTSDGGYVISGHSRSADEDVSGNEGFHDYWILKIDANGNKQWDKNFGFSGSDQAFKVFETKDGGYFASGFLDVSASEGEGNDDRNREVQHGVGEYWAIKMDSSGDWVWRRYFGGSNNDRSYSALETADEGFLLVGASESDDFDITDSKGSYDFWAVRIDKDGTLLWTKSFGGTQIDIGYAVTKTSDGNYLMVGDVRSTDGDVTNPLGNADAWAVKFSETNGDIIWQKTYGGGAFESARSIRPISNNRYLLSASTRSNNGDISVNKGENDAWIFIISENGALQFEMTIGGTNLDFAQDALETSDGKLVIVGNTESNDVDISENQGLKDLLIIKLK